MKSSDGNSFENNIFSVRECLNILGGKCEDKRIIIDMITRVARADPELMKQDGEKRIEAIKNVVKEIDKYMDSARKKHQETMESIAVEEETEKEDYASDIAAIQQEYQVKVAQLKAETEGRIKARKEKSKAHLAELETQRSQSEQKKERAEQLDKEMIVQSNILLREINSLMKYLNIDP